ncbi:MAG: chemotaxis protein CheX [Lachnospiraceae bacterium]|nr:chemotaxis protein CheX [Lachnospiraceae bacterium]
MGITMAGIISVNHINPFLLSAQQILVQVCSIQTNVGQLSKENMCIDGESVFIMLGITGEMTGQVCIVFDLAVAKDVASRMMMGMPVAEIDDMAKSALSELGNMIMGNAATLLSNNDFRIDITPPTLGMGATRLSSPNMTSIKVPLVYESGEVKLYFLLKLA